MILTVHVKPNAKNNSVGWVDDDTLKISTTAKPENGKANLAVIELLSEELKIKKSAIKIVRGHTTRIKQVAVLL